MAPFKLSCYYYFYHYYYCHRANRYIYSKNMRVWYAQASRRGANSDNVFIHRTSTAVSPLFDVDKISDPIHHTVVLKRLHQRFLYIWSETEKNLVSIPLTRAVLDTSNLHITTHDIRLIHTNLNSDMAVKPLQLKSHTLTFCNTFSFTSKSH